MAGCPTTPSARNWIESKRACSARPPSSRSSSSTTRRWPVAVRGAPALVGLRSAALIAAGRCQSRRGRSALQTARAESVARVLAAQLLERRTSGSPRSRRRRSCPGAHRPSSACSRTASATPCTAAVAPPVEPGRADAAGGEQRSKIDRIRFGISWSPIATAAWCGVLRVAGRALMPVPAGGDPRPQLRRASPARRPVPAACRYLSSNGNTVTASRSCEAAVSIASTTLARVILPWCIGELMLELALQHDRAIDLAVAVLVVGGREPRRRLVVPADQEALLRVHIVDVLRRTGSPSIRRCPSPTAAGSGRRATAGSGRGRSRSSRCRGCRRRTS